MFGHYMNRSDLMEEKTWLDYHHEMMEQCDKALGQMSRKLAMKALRKRSEWK